MESNRRGPLLIGAAVFLPLLIFVAVLVAFSARERRRQVEEQAIAEASTLMIRVDAALSRSLGALDALAALPPFAEGDLQRAYVRAHDIAALNPDWVTVTFHHLNSGRELFDLRRPLDSPAPPAGVAGRPPANLPEKAYAGGMGGEGKGCPCILADRIIRGSDGDLYLLIAAVDPAPFQQLTLAASAPNKLTGLVDREGDFIGRSIAYREKLGTPGSASLRRAVASGRPAGIYSGLTLEGVANYTAFARSPLSGWSAHIAFAPTLLDVPRRRMVAAAGMAAVAALALAFFLTWFTLRQLAEGRLVEGRLQDAQKFEALGQLTGGIAHDFNNLLTPILGGLDLLARRDGLDDRSRRLAEGALASARKAAKLTGQLLAFSRRQRLEIRPVDLQLLLDELQPLLSQSVGPDIEIRVYIKEDGRCVLSDSNQLELAILNLVVNARDALPEGGTIVIAAAARPGAGEAGKVALTVTDNGIGMSPEVLRRAPEPFFTTKPAGSGTGLGLAQVRGIVEQSEGALAIDSEVGRGTIVTIMLPACEMPPDIGPPQLAAAMDGPSAARRVLVCDDDDAVRSFVARTLDEAGYAVEAVADGRTAVEAARNWHPDLLVVDFAMPAMNGAEVAGKVAGLHRAPAVLMITGYADSEAMGAIGDGVPILRKPFEADTLLAAVRRTIEGRKAEA